MARPAPEAGEITAAKRSRVGMELRTARERLGWDLPTVAAGLRIKHDYLTAIEEGRLADLPGSTYAARFLHTYADALGLDPDEVSRRSQAEPAEINPKAELTSPAPVPERGVPRGAVALVAVVLAIGIYFGWQHFAAPDRRAARRMPPVPARLAAPAGGGRALATPPPHAASVGPAPLPPAAAPAATHPAAAKPAAAPEPPAAPRPDVPPMKAAAATPPPASAPLAAAPANPEVSPIKPPSAGGTAAAGSSHMGGSHILLRATTDAWVQVRQKSGRVLLNRVLRSGETWPVPADPQQLLLSTGNAGGTELVVDGVTGAPLGSSGEVRHDVPLDPALIRQGGLAAGAPAAPGSTALPAAR